MFTALKEIGEVEKERRNEFFSLYRDMFDSVKEEELWFVIAFTDVEKRDFELEVAEFDGEGNFLYFSREKFDSIRFLYRKNYFTDGLDFLSRLEKKSEVYARMKEFLEKEKERRKEEGGEKRKRAGLSKIFFKIDGKYPLQIDDVRDLFIKRLRSNMGRKRIRGECFLCGKKRDVFFSSWIFTFLTVDNVYLSLGLSENRAYENFTVCEECLELARIGKRWVMEREFRVFGKGFDMYVIPKLFFSGKEERKKRLGRVLDEVEEVIREGEEIVEGSRECGWSCSEECEECRELAAEELIERRLGRVGAGVNFYFLFLAREEGGRFGSVERIEFLIENVIPSRLKFLDNVRKETDRKMRKLTGTDYCFRLIKLYELIKDCYGEERTARKRFLEILRTVYTGYGCIRRESIFRIIGNGIRRNYKDFVFKGLNGSGGFEIFKKKVWDAFASIEFLEKAKVLEGEGVIMFKDNRTEQGQFQEQFESMEFSGDEPLEESLENFSRVLNRYFEERGLEEIERDEGRRLAFLTGVLVGTVRYVQKENGVGFSFLKKLKNFDLSPEEIAGVARDALKKLYEYNRETGFACAVFREVGMAFFRLKAREKGMKKLNTDELNLCLALGITDSFGVRKLWRDFLEGKERKERNRENKKEEEGGGRLWR